MKTLLSRFTLSQVFALIGAAALITATVWGASYLANRMDYQVVFSDVEPAETQRIVQHLRGQNVDFKVASDGRSISVPSEKASEVRIQLASLGLPSNDQPTAESELARSIMSLAEVEAARVHLSEDQKKASVILKLKNGRLSPTAASGIINVVAGSVEGLTPERVTLIDYRGRVLARPESVGTLSGQQLDERQRLESELAGKIVQILEPVVGQGKVRPQISVSMNFQQVEETTEHYDPQSAVVRSEQKQEEHASANAADHPVIKTQTLNYEVNKAVRHTVEPAGRVESISTAVIVDNRSKAITRTPEEMQKYREIVSAAIGFNADRGDKLTLENVSFEGDVDLVQEPAFLEKQTPVLLAALRYLIIPTAFILVYLVLLRPMKTLLLSAFASSPAPIPFAVAQKPMTVKQLEAQLAAGQKTKSANPRAPEREIMPQPGQSKLEAIRERVIEQASQNPENVARMVRVWLNERSK